MNNGVSSLNFYTTNQISAGFCYIASLTRSNAFANCAGEEIFSWQRVNWGIVSTVWLVKKIEQNQLQAMIQDGFFDEDKPTKMVAKRIVEDLQVKYINV